MKFLFLFFLILILIFVFISSTQINNINKYLRKFKKIQNLIILLFSIISVFNLTNIKTKRFGTNTAKRNLSQSTKKFIASNQKWVCNICKNTLDHTYEVDHIIPLFKGGGDNNNNLQALCRNCHGKKTALENL